MYNFSSNSKYIAKPQAIQSFSITIIKLFKRFYTTKIKNYLIVNVCISNSIKTILKLHLS